MAGKRKVTAGTAPGGTAPAGKTPPRKSATGSAGAGKSATGTVAVLKDRVGLDTDQTGSDADQTRSDTDQTGSDADQTESEADQRASNTDQSASDADQATADREHVGKHGRAEERAHDASRADRAKMSRARLATAADRGRTAEARGQVARDRDSVAADRDEQAGQRDTRAVSLERAIAETDRPSARKFEKMREEAAADRAQAASDRERAAADREVASRELTRLEADLLTANLDDLTGAFRRDIGRLELSREIARARRDDGRFVVAFVDVDGLKSINDRDGHAAGDQALRAVVTEMRVKLRTFDPILRYGGDEFVAGIGGTDLNDVEQRFEDIRASLKERAGIGVSVGLARLEPGETADEVMARADRALYAGRANARLTGSA